MARNTVISVIAIILGLIIIAFPLVGVIASADILGLSVLLLAIFLLSNGIAEVDYSSWNHNACCKLRIDIQPNNIRIPDCINNLPIRNIPDNNRINHHHRKQRQQIWLLDWNTWDSPRCHIYNPWNLY